MMENRQEKMMNKEIRTDNIQQAEKTEIGELNYGIPVSQIITICENILNEIVDNFGESEEERKKLYRLINNLCINNEYSGDANDIHNLSTTLARKDEYRLACDVLECGLQRYPNDVDLLADYLQNGIKCGRGERLEEIYDRLEKVPIRKYTWRGFMFLIEYLQYLIDQTNDEKVIEMYETRILEIADAYKKYYPHSEDPYSAVAQTYKMLNEWEKQADILKEAMEAVNICPKCAVQMADILFDEGRFDEAKMAVERAKKDAIQTQSSVKDGYIYYLSALCTIGSVRKENREYSQEEIESIYKDFNLALEDLCGNRAYVSVIKNKTNIIANQTQTKVDDERYEKLAEIIN